MLLPKNGTLPALMAAVFPSTNRFGFSARNGRKGMACPRFWTGMQRPILGHETIRRLPPFVSLRHAVIARPVVALVDVVGPLLFFSRRSSVSGIVAAAHWFTASILLAYFFAASIAASRLRKQQANAGSGRRQTPSKPSPCGERSNRFGGNANRLAGSSPTPLKIGTPEPRRSPSAF